MIFLILTPLDMILSLTSFVIAEMIKHHALKRQLGGDVSKI